MVRDVYLVVAKHGITKQYLSPFVFDSLVYASKESADSFCIAVGKQNPQLVLEVVMVRMREE